MHGGSLTLAAEMHGGAQDVVLISFASAVASSSVVASASIADPETAGPWSYRSWTGGRYLGSESITPVRHLAALAPSTRMNAAWTIDLAHNLDQFAPGPP